MQPVRPARQDTFDLRDQIHTDDHIRIQSHADAANYAGTDDEEHSVLEDDSDGEERDVDYVDEDDDGSSSLSIPNESIDFDLVYSLHSFAATVEGQANVVKGDSLFLMDDSNSYWWLVRVLKTQEVGYIPAENIETPFERLARLNKHRNVDLASATQAELQEDVHASRERLRNNISSRAGSNQTPSPVPRANGGSNGQSKGVAFRPALSVHRYPPAVWNEDEEEEEDVEWDDGVYEDEDMDLAQEQMHQHRGQDSIPGMEPDDGMGWDDSVAQEMQARQGPMRSQAQNNGSSGVMSGFGGEITLQTTLQQQQQQLQAQAQAQAQQQLQQQKQMQIQQQLLAQQQQQAAMQQQAQHALRSQSSRERLAASQDPTLSTSQPAPGRVDLMEVTETKKLTMTPTIARDVGGRDEQESKGPLLPSVLMQKQDEERKRTREEIEALEESARKKVQKGKMAAPVSSTVLTKPNPNSGGKLRKEPHHEDDSSKDKEKKKKGSVFGGLFSRKKDKGKEKPGSSSASIDSASVGEMSRGSEDSARSGSRPSVSATDTGNSPTTTMAIQQQQQHQLNPRSSIDPKRPSSAPQPFTSSSPVSQHASQLRQRDQQQQALYQQYLNRSPSSPPEAQANYGLQTAAALAGSSSFNTSAGSASGLGLGPPAARPRPGSLVLSPTALDGQGVVPELSVIRVFAGKNLQTEATFKTVLLNSLTTSSDLVRQAIQRFRLPSGENESDYYLTVKQVEGSSAVLLDSEHPLRVFEMLVEAALELPKVKRSSVGSISSVSSNLSMHPAIKKLSMNDFTDDSAVKFYLNRRSEDGVEDSVMGHDDDKTIVADNSLSDSERSQYLTVSPQSDSVTPERFNSPSFRFALQLVIYPDDLPDDMVFDPMTEAIVFKHTLRDRPTHSSSSTSTGISQNMRRKVFVFPKNVTVAEVIELGLERFGILEGVVDGGDEVEDKLSKRRSMARVRYGLTIDTGSHERELAPSSKVIDAYTTPPTYRAVGVADRKRRSVDSTQLLGNSDDVNADDPVFILRRAVSYRNSSSRHRMSAPLDEIALQHLHRESASSASSDTQMDDSKPKQPSRQEIIAAQRAEKRANQRAILSAQTNSVRGVDVLLPDNAMIRSSRYEVDDRMRYSYVQPDGEIYDISDIVEEEWRDNTVSKNDLLEVALVRNKDGIGDKIDRVLSKLKNGKAGHQPSISQSSTTSTLESNTTSIRSTSPSEYTLEGPSPADGRNSRAPTPGSGARTLTPTPGAQQAASMAQSLAKSQPDLRPTKTRPMTPPTRPVYGSSTRQPSIASVMSDISVYATPQTIPSPVSEGVVAPRPKRKVPILPKDDFGIPYMMAIIDYTGSIPKTSLPRLHPVDELLYGRKFDPSSLHPAVKDIYSESFKRLDDMDRVLDEFIRDAISDY